MRIFKPKDIIYMYKISSPKIAFFIEKDQKSKCITSFDKNYLGVGWVYM